MTYISSFREEHESFPQPEDGAMKVWRYIDLAKLVALLKDHTLPLVRVDLLKDEFEGSLTRAVYETWKSDPHLAELMTRIGPAMRRDVYVSCWHANDAESEAMWRLYCGSNDGIALQTSNKVLDASLPKDVMLGTVSYLDYETAQPPPENSLTPLMHKRRAFEHEREVRALLWRPAFHVAQGLKPNDFPRDSATVFTVPWNAADAIEQVFVSPYAEEWYRDVVVAVLQKFEPAMVDRLTWSRMKGVPLF